MPSLRVDEHPPLHDDAAVIRPHETADGVHERRLAGSRGTEQGGELSVRPEARLEVEGALRMPDVDVEDHYARTRRRIRRASHSDSQSAATEMTMDTSVRRMAPLSPPGTCVIGVDGGGNGLRLAGNVRHEGDRRAELAHRLGEGQHHAGDDARHDERQSYHGEHPDRMSAERSRRILQLAVDGCDGQADRAHQQREAHDGAGERRAGPAEREHDAEMLRQEGADRAAPAETEQQEPADDDRRQNQGEMDENVKELPPPEAPALQQRARWRCRERGSPPSRRRRLSG